MGSALEIGIKFRKVVFVSFRRCYRSVCNHPFLVAFLGFLFLLYRFFPFLFSVLVSASPVLVCTAVLLGTLLSFGQPNLLPEIDEREEEKVTHHGVSAFQTGFSEGHTVVADREDEDQSYFVKGYSENRSDVEEESGIEEASLLGEADNRDDEEEDNKDDGEEDNGLISDVLPEEDEKFRDVQPEKQVKEAAEREFVSFELGKKREIEENLTSEVVSSDEEAIEKQYVMVQRVDDDDDVLDGKNEDTPGDQAEFSASSSWKQVENSDDEVESVESGSGSGSDQAESSSPDASMADIMPMLDELHPLLDLDAPQPAHLSRDDSDAASSDKSQESDDDSVESESDEDAEQHGEGEEGGIDEHDDERDDEEEEETASGKEDESKSAIKWTEDDQKNLMDLGTLELERNQRLENLIARRRARRLMVEKNLIDFDSADIPSNVAPIVTKRNPFDFPDESYTAMGLPPIPGSAPSILQPGRNPFDIPYDSNEEKPDLKGDSFQQEFSAFNHQKDVFFRRHESFSMGPSVLGISKFERHDINWKPVFISERMASEGTSYSSFQRQSSEVSDSKLSSVPDTESVSSIDQGERRFSEQDLSQEAEIISNIDHVSDGAEHGSQSSGENDSVEMIQVEESAVSHDEEAEIVLGGVEDSSEMEFYHETGDVEIPEQFDAARETQLRGDSNDEESSRSSSSRSSHSSQSEVIDNLPNEEMEKAENLHQDDEHLEESTISRQISDEESNFEHVSEMEDNQHVEPVYDSSPPAGEKLLSFPSVSSADSTTNVSERALPSISMEMTANVADKASEVHDQRLEDSSSGFEETQATSSKLDVEVKNELRSEKSEDISQHNVPADEFQDVPVSEDSNVSLDIVSVKGVSDSGFVHGQDLAGHLYADSAILLQDNGGGSPDSNNEMASEKSHDESVEEGAALDAVSAFDEGASSNDSSMPVAHDLQFSIAARQETAVHPKLPSEEAEHIKKLSPNKEDEFQIEQDKVLLSRSAEQGNTDIHQDLDQDVVSFTSESKHESDARPPSNLENRLSDSDKLPVAPSSSGYNENQNSDVIQVESSLRVVISNDDAGDLYDSATYKTPLNISYAPSEISESPEFSSPTGEVEMEVDRHGEVGNEDLNEALEHLDPLAESPMSEVTEESVKGLDDIKEIDEGFLSELDTIGDFNVNDAGLSLHTDNVPEKMTEVEQEIPVLEARSLEDINLAFKQLQEGVEAKEVILLSSIEDQLVSKEYKDQLEANSNLQVVEARSVGDIDIALNQISKGKDHLEDNSDIEVVEARPLADVALNQISKGNQGDLEVVEATPLGDTDIALNQISEGKNHLEDNSDLEVVEDRSLGDTDTALNQISEGNHGNLEVVEDRSLGNIDPTLNQISEGNPGDLDVVEAKSSGDIGIASNQTSEEL